MKIQSRIREKTREFDDIEGSGDAGVSRMRFASA